MTPATIELNIEAIAGMMAAEAVGAILETEADWQRFSDRWASPDAFAMHVYPDAGLARDGFLARLKAIMERRGVSRVEDVVRLRPLPPGRRRSPR
jgi:hypothetical protein